MEIYVITGCSRNEDRKHHAHRQMKIASIKHQSFKKKKRLGSGRKEAGARLRTGKELGDLEIKDY
jgi:hypothetical protein